MKKLVLHGFLFAVGLFVVLELFFRFVLPAADWPRGVILETSIRRFDNENFTSGRFTYGRYCYGGFDWSINNAGWNSVYDYLDEIDRNAPMVAILGDSYIEGFYSNVDTHIDVFLTEAFDDSVNFYSFAMSGGLLSQYIALMKYEVEQYSPDAYIIFVNSSDVSKSFREIGGRHPYYFQYSLDSLGVYREVISSSVSRSGLKDLLLRSAIIRYLKSNAQVSLFGAGIADENANQQGIEVSDAVETSIPGEVKDAAEFILTELNSFDKPVLIVADCPKAWIYDNREEEAYDDVIALREIITDFENVSILELSTFYENEYAEYARRFSVDGNPHWDSYANSFIARAIAPSVLELLGVDSGLGH